MQNGKLKVAIGSLFLVLVFFGYATRDDGKVPVTVNGVNHMGQRYTIEEFYIDGHAMGNIGREGGGGSAVCCMVLPGIWKASLQVDLRWEVYDHDEDRTRNYRASVPVEKYDVPGEIVVHIFRDHSVRFVSSDWGVMSPNHPVAWGVGDGGHLASKGVEISETFTQEEIRRLDERFGKRGTWR